MGLFSGLNAVNRWLLEDENGERGVDVGEVNRLSDPTWEAQFERLEVSDGLWLYFATIKAHSSVTVRPQADVIGRIGSQIPLDGNMSVRLPGDPEKEIDLDPKCGVVYRSIENWAQYRLEEGRSYRVMVWSVHDEVFMRLLGGDVPDSLAVLLEKDAQSTPMLPMIVTQQLRELSLQLFHTPLRGPLRRLEAEGTVLKIAALQFSQFISPSQQDDEPALSPHELKKIHEARDYLLADMREPPSLRKLSSFIGMDEKRLNAGFRIAFGMTAFELLRNERLEHARQILETEDIPLKVIAYRVGYRHVTNFSNAFARRYGTPPKRYAHDMTDDDDTSFEEVIRT